MTLVLIALSIVWAIFLVPPMLRHRREGRPDTSVASFRRQLSTLERATPGTYLRPVNPVSPVVPTRGASATSLTSGRSRSEVLRRRRDVLVLLGGSTAFTALLALAVGGMFTFLFLLSGAALGAYVYALVQLKNLHAERSNKVRVLRPHQQATAPVALRRAAN